VPDQDDLPAPGERPEPPIAALGGDEEHRRDLFRVVREPDELSTYRMADQHEGNARVPGTREVDRAGEVLLAPLVQLGAEAGEPPRRAGAPHSPRVEGGRGDAVLGEERRERTIESPAHAHGPGHDRD